MADVLAERITNCQDDCIEVSKRVDAIEEVQSEISDRVYKQEYWRDGNGAKGAEARLQGVENVVYDYQTNRVPERLNLAEADINALQHIADGKISEVVRKSVKDHMDSRDKTIIAYVRAFGPYVAALAAIIAALWGRV